MATRTGAGASKVLLGGRFSSIFLTGEPRAVSSFNIQKSVLMKRFLLSVLAAAAACSAPAAARAQTGASGASPVINRSGAPADVERIVRAMAQKETEFRRALNEYEFKRDAVIQTIAWGGQISGEYHRTSRFVFDDSGKRYEKILFFPMPTIQEIQVTPEDIEDLGGVQAFALEASKFNDYSFAYVGKEKLDEIDTYVF